MPLHYRYFGSLAAVVVLVMNLVGCTRPPAPAQHARANIAEPTPATTVLSTAPGVQRASVMALRYLPEPPSEARELLEPKRELWRAFAAPAPEPAPVPRLAASAWLPGDGPSMRGERVGQTAQLDFYVGKGTLTPDEVAWLVPNVEWALYVMESRFGERLRQRVSIGYYRPAKRNLRGIAYTDEARCELYYSPGENPVRAVAVTAHELAHHLQYQRYGEALQRRADTILLEGAATWISGDSWLPMAGAKNWRERARQLRDSGVPLVLMTAERYGANNAYELWASFVDYLLQTYGAFTYRDLYSSGRGRSLGSADYQGVLGKSLDELADDWRAWINSDK